MPLWLPTIRFGCCLLLAVLGLMGVGCKPIQVNGVMDRLEPSNDRNWSPDLAMLSHSSGDPYSKRIKIDNIRNSEYVTENDFVVSYYEKEFSLTDVQSVDFIVVPFNNAKALAHTMMSFGFRDGTYLVASIEIRTEEGESFNPVLGATRQYELTYLFADERDVIRLRTRHRNAEVYIYPTNATPEQTQRLLVDVLERANKLVMEPEFYDTITNNCTTNLAGHVNTVADNQIKYGFQVLLPGFSAKYAYELGLLPTEVPFEDLKELSHVNDLVEKYYDDPDFSQKIRERRGRIERLAQWDRDRAPVVNGRGDDYLQKSRSLLR